MTDTSKASAGRCQQLAVFIDVANAEGIDLRRLLAGLARLGELVEVRAYGDFRQRHLDEVAIDMYAQGIHMVHSPSWPNGARADGSTRRKRCDDRLMEKEVRDLIHRRPSIATYALVTSDADIIPTVNALRENGKEVILFCPWVQQKLGHVLRMCDVPVDDAPLKPGAITTDPPGARELRPPSAATADTNTNGNRIRAGIPDDVDNREGP
jgi:hypothetical protein